MGLFNKDGNIRPAAELIKEMRRPQRGKHDASLVLFSTRIPKSILDKFVKETRRRGDKIQTVIKKMMEIYIREDRDNGRD